MAILPNDIRFFYSGGSSNQDPLASLGGIISKTQIINEAQENVFNNVTLIEADNGMTDYRCFYVKNIGNELWRSVVIWREKGTDSGTDAVFIGLGSSIIDGIEQEVPDRFTKPTNVTFSGPATPENALTIGNLAPGSHKSVWIQRVVESGTRTFKNNSFKLRVEMGNPAGGGVGGGLPPGTPPGGGGPVQCPTGQHAVNNVCIPDTVSPIIGGENILWQSTAWSNGRDRTITTDQGADPDDTALTFGFGSNPSLQIKGATDPGFVLQSGTDSHVMVSRNSSIANHYNASLEIQKFFFNTSVTSLNLRLRSRAYEGGVTANRYAGYEVVITRSTSSIHFRRYDHLLNASTNTFDFTILAPSQINLSSALQDGVEYGLRYSVRDIIGGVELKLEMKGGAFGNSYVAVGNVTDTVAPPDALNKTLYINNRSYFHINVVGSPVSNCKYGFVVLRDLDKNVSTTCPQGYTLVNGICRADTLGTPPPAGGGGATIADYTMTTVGDTTCGSTAQTITSRIVARNPNFHLPLGDYTYTSSTTCWISMMAPLKPKILGIVIGNHDDAEDESNTLRDRYLSEYGQSLPYHAFTFRNTFVLVLYTYSPFGFGSSSAQYQFARQQLEAARNNPAIDWIICAFHKPIYTAASNHSGYTAFRDIYHPLFDQFKVDICLSGHVHNYQRTKPLKYTGTGTGNSIANNQTTNYIDLVNPIFLIVGSGGREISSISSQPSYNAAQRAGFGYNIFSWSNNGKRITGRHYDQGDVLRDEWTMDKTSVSNPPTNPPTEPPPPTGGGTTGGQLDNLGIRWIMATGAQVVDGQSRNESADKRWSTNHDNIADNGYECTAYFTFSGTNSSSHFAMKMWGPNHSGCTNATRCFWYDIGIRHDGEVQLQYERPHPNNHNFSLTLNTSSGPKYMNNIGLGMSGNTIGLKWIIYPVIEGGTSDSAGGIRIKFFADTSGFSGGKPQNQWRRVVDFVDNGQVRPSNTTTHQEQDLEIRVSDTNSVTTYGGGKHVRRLSRADINRGEMTGGGGGTTNPPPTSSPLDPPTNVDWFYDSTATQNSPQTINSTNYDTTEGIIACSPYDGVTSTVISGGYINIKDGTTGHGRIYVDYFKKSRFAQDDLPGFNIAATFSFVHEDTPSLPIVDSGNEYTQTNFDNLNTIFGGFRLFFAGNTLTPSGYRNELSANVRYWADTSDPLTAGRNGVRTPPGNFPFPSGKTFVLGNTYKVFYLLRTNRDNQTVVLNAWIDFGDGWTKIIADHAWDRFFWSPGNVPAGFIDTGQILTGPDVIKRHRFVIRNDSEGSSPDMKVKDIKIGTVPFLPDPVIPDPPVTPPPSGTPGNDANGIKIIYPTKPDGDTLLWQRTGNSRLGILNLAVLSSSSGQPWTFLRSNSGSPSYIILYTVDNGVTNLNTTQLSQSPPITTFNQNTLASLGHFYQARDWKNVEFTIYFAVVEGNNPSDSKDMSLVVRSANHTLAFGGCGGSSYHADYNWATGGVRFKKEQYHNNYAMDTHTPTAIGPAVGKYVGIKFVVWNRSDGNVELELWADRDGSNQWSKYINKTDSHNWGTASGQCAGTPPGKAITWGSPVAYIKWNSNDNITISYMSIREIFPPS